MSMNAQVMDLEDNIIELEHEVEKLRAALKPFADCDLTNNSQAYDKDHIAGRWPNVVTFGDVRRAHDVIYPPVLP